MATRFSIEWILIFVFLPDYDILSRYVEPVESYDDCPKKLESGGAGGT